MQEVIDRTQSDEFDDQAWDLKYNKSRIATCENVDLLIRCLKTCAEEILDNLDTMAAVLKRLDHLGVEVTIDHALMPYIRMIAAGTLSSACFLACAAEPKLLAKAVSQPKYIQDKIASDEPFDVVRTTGEVDAIKPSEMTPKELAQAFASEHYRKPKEQVKWLQGSVNKSTSLKGKVKGPQTPDRCPTCRARLAKGVECLKCKLDDASALAKLKRDEAKGIANREHYNTAEPAEPDDDWKARQSALRAVKQNGDELGFHIDWLIAFCGSAKNLPMKTVEKLSKLERAIRESLDKL